MTARVLTTGPSFSVFSRLEKEDIGLCWDMEHAGVGHLILDASIFPDLKFRRDRWKSGHRRLKV